MHALEGQPTVVGVVVRRRLPRLVGRLAPALAIALAFILVAGGLVAGSSDLFRVGSDPMGVPVGAAPNRGAGPNGGSASGGGGKWGDDPAAVGGGAGGAPQTSHLPVRAVDPDSAREPVARLVYRVRTTAKVVALTFDDGWKPSNGHKILDILLRDHVPATFFLNSVYIRRDRALWKAIAKDGFVVGNHTYLHRDVTKMTEAAIVAELLKNARVFHELTGATMAPLFRPPYGYRTPETDAAAARAGFGTIVVWDTLAGDAIGQRSDAQLTHAALHGRSGSIVLMHVGPDSTPRFLEAVIAGYRARGFSFVTIPQLLALRSSS